MKNFPNKWWAALLGLVVPTLGLLYVARWKWAVVATAVGLVLAVLDMLYLHHLDGLGTVVNTGVALYVCRLAFVQARDFDSARVRPAYSRWPALVLTVVVVALGIVGFRAFVYEPFRAAAGSMQPGIPVGARLVVQKWGYGNYGTYGMHFVRSALTQPVERGDVLVFEVPPLQKLQYVKRVVALPGDTVLMRDGRLTVNADTLLLSPMADYLDELSMRYFKRFQEGVGPRSYDVLFDDALPPVPAPQEPFAHMENCRYEPHEITCKVPEGHYYFMGDNRNNSFDSRFWGFVPQANVLGKVVYVSP